MTDGSCMDATKVRQTTRIHLPRQRVYWNKHMQLWPHKQALNSLAG